MAMNKMTAQAKFYEFHKQHPEVLKMIVQFIEQVKAAGFQQYSINGIFERLRWHVMIDALDTKTKVGFQLPNEHKTAYVRLIEELHPEHVGFFVTRTSRIWG